MKPFDLGIAILVAWIWGINFIAIKEGVADMTPEVFTLLRAVFSFFPLIFFIKKPAVSWPLLIGLGITIGMLKHLLISLGIAQDMCAALVSLLLQSQAFFTVLLAFLMLGERPKLYQIIGMMIAFIGILVIGYDQMCIGTLSGVMCLILAALCWGCANIMMKQTHKKGPVSMVNVMVWISMVPILPLFFWSEYRLGMGETWHVLTQITWVGMLGVLYGALLSGVAGYALWGYLLQRYPAAVVAPFSMMVPAVATLISVFVYEDIFTYYAIGGMILVCLGLGINQFYPSLKKTLRR